MSLRLDLQLARSRNSVQSEREFIIRNRLLMLFALKKHRSSAAVGRYSRIDSAFCYVSDLS